MNKELTSILNDLGLSDLLSLFEAQDIDDSVLADLSDAELKGIGIDKLGTRKKLLAAFGKPGGGGAATVSVVEDSMPQAASSSAASKTAATPAAATKDSPWVNTLGMPFVPIPRFETRFCVWPVRVQDYEAYCMASGAQFPEIPFSQESEHPIVGVSWDDAIEFCVWLTDKERGEAKIDDKTVYRLPTDLEWSAAVGLPHEPEALPAGRHLVATGYPWGLRWPPPKRAGNYEHARSNEQTSLLLKIAASSQETYQGWLEHAQARGLVYGNSTHEQSMADLKIKINNTRALADQWHRKWSPVDSDEFTSAVTEFAPNFLGIYDLGGNVWEWCMDSVSIDGGLAKVARGGSFALAPNYALHKSRDPYQPMPLENDVVYRSSYRHFGTPETPLKALEKPGHYDGRIPCGGLRLVVAVI
jgi:formylglycine-generating enzyme required for sulfatase activity